MYFPTEQWPFSLLLVVALILTGCSSMQFRDMFSGYGQQMQSVRHSVQTAHMPGDFTQAVSLVAEVSRYNNNYILSLLEKGRLQFLANNWSASRESFAQAYEVIEKERDKAKIRISKGVENMAAMLSSDNAMGYQIPPYELNMLHTYQALNYLYLGNIEGALVEVRRANLVNENAIPEDPLAPNEQQQTIGRVNAVYPSMSAVIGEASNRYQNAYTFYISGLIYEAASELGDAYIDYKRALALAPNNRYLQQDVLRLATKLAMQNDLVKLTPLYGEYQAPQGSSGEVLVLIEQDLVAEKVEVGLDLPIFTSQGQPRFFKFALPVYQNYSVVRKSITVKAEQQSYTSMPLLSVSSLAALELQQTIPGLVTRQALRLVAKEKLRSTVSRKGGDLGNILASLYNIASENADTRSWLTLPENVQILRIPLAAGQHTLSLNDGRNTQSIEVIVNPNRATLVKVTALAGYQNYKVLNL